MAITVTTDEIYHAFYADYLAGKAFMHSHTYSGNPLGCSASLAVLKQLREEDILEKANLQAQYLHKQLCKNLLEHPNVGEIRTIGLINAIELVKDKHTKETFNEKLRIGYQIYKDALENGLILRPLGDVLYFNPPLIIEKNDIDQAISICVRSIENILPQSL